MMRYLLAICSLAALVAFAAAGVARADDENHSGQGQQTQGSATANPANPAQDDKPSYPGDQPAKQGMDPSSQVHNIEPRDLAGKKHKESERSP
jgi:hypothetical protein